MRKIIRFLILICFFSLSFTCYAQKNKLPKYFLCNTAVAKEISIDEIRQLVKSKNCDFLRIIDTLGNKVKILGFDFAHMPKNSKPSYVEYVQCDKPSKKIQRRLRKPNIGDGFTIANVKCIMFGEEKLLNGFNFKIVE